MYKDKMVRALENWNSEDNYRKKRSFSDRMKSFFSKVKNNPFYFITKRIHKRKEQNNKINQRLYDYNWDDELSKKMQVAGDQNKKFVVYTCITGGYDLPKEPLYYSENIDYVMFTTEESFYGQEVSGWNCCEIPSEVNAKNNSLINRYIKLHPFDLFGGKYDVAIYVDGNIKIMSDISVLSELINPNIGMGIHKHSCRVCVYDEIDVCRLIGKGNDEKLKEQSEKYKIEGFPKNYGLLECNVLVTDLQSNGAKKIYEAWWNELVATDSGRDQVSLPYVCWKQNISIEDIGTLGLNVYRNPKLKVYSHNV